ncbi:hypothetical protein ACHAPQ_003792 [Fusarium lateritium]
MRGVVVNLQTKVSLLERQRCYEQHAGDLLDSSDDKQPAGPRSSETSSKLDQYRTKYELSEAAKRKTEKERAEHLRLIRQLQVKLEEKQNAADEERAESERKDLKIDLLRKRNLEQYRSLESIKKIAEPLQKTKEHCNELQPILQIVQQLSVPGALGALGKDQIKTTHDTTTKEVKRSRDGHESARKRLRPNPPPSNEEENILVQHMGDLALRAEYFTVLNDGDFDLQMAATFTSYIGQDGDYRQLRSFFDHAYRDQWFCLQDVVNKGNSALGLNVKKCSQHEIVRCILVKVTLVDSTRQLCFTYNRPHTAGC